MYGLIKRAYNQFMKLGIDIIFKMKTIGTNKGINDVWIMITYYPKL